MATGRTWADVARKKTPPALQTECEVDLAQYAVPLRLPPASSRHSAYLPLPEGFKPEWLYPTLTSLPPSAIGIVPQLDISLIEVCFADREAQHTFFNTPFTSEHLTCHPVPPAGTTPLYVPVKLINVPVLGRVVLETKIRSLWSTFGEVVALAPHTVKGLTLLTNRWDMVLKLRAAGTPLPSTPFMDILGFKVMASWPGSTKACP